MALENVTSDNPAVFHGIFELFDWLPVSETSKLALIIAATVCFVHLTLVAAHPGGDVPQLHYKESTLSRHLIRTVPRLRQPYVPPIWECGGHAQTLLAMLRPQTRTCLRLLREHLQVSCDGLVTLDWAVAEWPDGDEESPPPDPSAPVVIFVPDATGGPSLMVDACDSALLHGFRPVIFHGRGTAGAPLTSPRLLSFGDPTDFREAVEYVRERWPQGRIAAVGYGTGNALLLSYLGEYGSSTHLGAAAAISPVWDMQAFAMGCPRPYCWLELHARRIQLLDHAETLRKVSDVAAALKSGTVGELCENVYAPMYGYKSREEFWDKNNPLRDVDDIAIPLLAIQSLNDPITSRISIPYDLFRVYLNFFLVTTDHGGHCAFYEDGRPSSWALQLSLEYLHAVLDFFENDYME